MSCAKKHEAVIKEKTKDKELEPTKFEIPEEPDFSSNKNTKAKEIFKEAGVTFVLLDETLEEYDDQ